METENKKAMILIVDDVAKNLQVLGAILYQQDFEIAMADNGKAALDMLDELKPDLILLDIMMPEMDGFEVCTKIKANPETADIPIIFLTAKHETESIVKGFEKGAVDYITKPFNSSELLARVNTHISIVRYRHDIEQYNKELKQLLDQKSEFLGIAAHDMKSPLNSIQGFTNLMINELDNINCQDRDVYKNVMSFATSIKDTSGFMFRTINEMLNNETLDSGKLQMNITETDLGNILKSVIVTKIMAAEAKGIKINATDYGDCKADVDEDRFREIVENLVSNAIKYSPKGKDIWLSLTKYILNGEYYLKLSVRDEGQGLSEDDMGKVFGKFQKLSARPTGGETSTGLGLSIVKKLAELHGAEVKVESKPGQGADFIVTMKIKDSQAAGYPDKPEYTQLTHQNVLRTNVDDSFQMLAEDTELLEVPEDCKDKIPDIVSKLECHYMSLWEKITKSNVINDIKKFAVDIRSVGKESHLDILVKYGEELNTQAITFDLEKLPQTLNYYPELVKKLNRQMSVDN